MREALPVRYATERANDAALARGFDFSYSDWRGVFLAITDVCSGEPPKAQQHLRAERVGAVREGERWTIHWWSRSFDVIYDPHTAIISNVTDTKRPATAGHIQSST